MKTITYSQWKYIRDIEKNLNVEYEGDDSYFDAVGFIDLFGERNTQYNIDHNIKLQVTEKQAKFIRGIEAILRIKFNGNNLEEAKDFIDRYKSEFYKTKRIMTRTKRYLEAQRA